jgi:hypothetical protein
MQSLDIVWPSALVCELQFSAAQQDVDEDEQQTKNEHSGKNAEEDNADVGVWRSRKNKIVNPKADESDGGTAGEHDADEAESVLAEVVQQPRPIFHGILRTHVRSVLVFAEEKMLSKKAPAKDTPGPVTNRIIVSLPEAGAPANHKSYFTVAK